MPDANLNLLFSCKTQFNEKIIIWDENREVEDNSLRSLIEATQMTGATQISCSKFKRFETDTFYCKILYYNDNVRWCDKLPLKCPCYYILDPLLRYDGTELIK